MGRVGLLTEDALSRGVTAKPKNLNPKFTRLLNLIPSRAAINGRQTETATAPAAAAEVARNFRWCLIIWPQLQLLPARFPQHLSLSRHFFHPLTHMQITPPAWRIPRPTARAAYLRYLAFSRKHVELSPSSSSRGGAQADFAEPRLSRAA